MVAGPQKSRLRPVGEVCCSKFDLGSFSLAFSVVLGEVVPLAVFRLSVVHGYTKSLNRANGSDFSVKESQFSLTGFSSQKRAKPGQGGG